MEQNIQISLEGLWGSEEFSNSEWEGINYLVGPNGTGKTRFVEKIEDKFRKNSDLNVRYLNAERLSGMESKSNSATNLISSSKLEPGVDLSRRDGIERQAKNAGNAIDSYTALLDNLDIKISVEALISSLFDRNLNLREEGGYVVPKLQAEGSSEYDLKENECHGLKELIPLLTFIHNDEYDVIIIDEPELHLHPQFQVFLMSQVRKKAGDPSQSEDKKIFFIVSHSPYTIDVKTIDELRNLLRFQKDHKPSSIDSLDEDDEYKIKKLLPRMNTHHKQFFFASNPVFVEGYSDQQLFALIQEIREKFIQGSGYSFIDVGGKDEIDVFYRLCKQLGMNPKAICDLDTILKGNIVPTVAEKDTCRSYLQDEGIEDLTSYIGETEKLITEIVEKIGDTQSPESELISVLKEIIQEASESKDKRYPVLVTLMNKKTELINALPDKRDELNTIESKIRKTLKAFEKAGVYILPKGELENYLPNYNGKCYNVPSHKKQDLFNEARKNIISKDKSEINEELEDLVKVLDKCTKTVEYESEREAFLKKYIADWIHKVQSIFDRDGIESVESLKNNPDIEWEDKFSDLLKINSFESKSDDDFKCTIKLRSKFNPQQPLTFNSKENPTEASKKLF